ncbi:MAG: serine/threonine-protein kinase [Myxococcota bacterium]
MSTEHQPRPPSDPQGIGHRRMRSAIERRLFGTDTPVRIGRYRIEHEVGRGGMGVVYQAHDPELDRRVAVKVLRPGSSALRMRLLLEARSMAQVTDANIVPVYDVGEEDAQVFVVMEFIEGESLGAWLERAPPFPEIVARFIDAGAGLWGAHRAGLVHRDFKPSNVIIGNDGRVRVVDFGLARNTGGSGTELEASAGEVAPVDLTATGALMGTPRYMAPEQHDGGHVGLAADQFSFCASLFEAVCRVPAFPGSTLEGLRAAKRELPTIPATVPPRLAQIFTRGLAEQADDRYPDMGALVDALRAVLRDTTEPDRARRRSRRLAWMGGAGLLVATGGLSWSSATPVPTALPCPAPTIAWDGEAASAVASRLGPDTPGYVHEAWQRFSARMSAQAEAIGEARDALCTPRGAPPPPSAGHEAALQCLATREGELRAIAELVADDPSVLSGSLEFGFRLPAPAECLEDAVRLRGTQSHRIDPRVHARLFKVKAWRVVGRIADAEALARELMEEAGAGPGKAAAQVQLAHILMTHGEGPDAAREGTHLLETAHADAVARNNDADALEAAASLLWHRADHGDLAGLDRWLRTVAALLERSELPATERAAATWAIGRYHDATGDDAEALRFGRRAVALAAEGVGAAHPQVAQYRMFVAGNLLRQGEHEAGTQALQAGLSVLAASYGEDHPRVAMVEARLGTADASRGRHASAVAHYDTALAKLAAARAPADRRMATVFAGRAFSHHALANVDAAIADYTESLAILVKARGAPDPRLHEMRSRLAAILPETGDLQRARSMAHRAWEGQRTTLGAEHPSSLPLCNRVAATLRAADTLARAEAVAAECVRIAATRAPAHPDRITAERQLDEIERHGRPSAPGL